MPIDYTFMFVVKAENIPSSALTFTLGIHCNAPSSMEICHGFIPVLPNDIMVLYHRQIILGTQPSYVCQKNRHRELDTLLISAPVFHLGKTKIFAFHEPSLIIPCNFPSFQFLLDLKKSCLCCSWCLKLEAQKAPLKWIFASITADRVPSIQRFLPLSTFEIFRFQLHIFFIFSCN